jgi:hypothetical protein
MGFFGNIISATVKVVMTPVAIAADVVTIVIQKPEQATHTKELLNSAGKDAEKAIDDIT